MARKLPNLNTPLEGQALLTFEQAQLTQGPRLDYLLTNRRWCGHGWSRREGVDPSWSYARCQTQLDYFEGTTLVRPKLIKGDEPVWEYNWRLDVGFAAPHDVDWVFFPTGRVLAIVDHCRVSGTLLPTLDVFVSVLDAYLRGRALTAQRAA